jgi:chromosome segregation ATPase
MKLDIKSILILVLGGILVFTIIFRPTKKIDTYEDEIEQLELKNDSLRNLNDLIGTENDSLRTERLEIQSKVDSIGVELEENKDKIKDLQNGKGKVSGYVKTLNADGVANSLTEYLNRKK